MTFLFAILIFVLFGHPVWATITAIAGFLCWLFEL